MKTPAAALLLTALAFTLTACSSQQVYGVGQAWQRNECFKIADQQERSRCLSSSSTSYEQYKREAAAASEPK